MRGSIFHVSAWGTQFFQAETSNVVSSRFYGCFGRKEKHTNSEYLPVCYDCLLSDSYQTVTIRTTIIHHWLLFLHGWVSDLRCRERLALVQVPLCLEWSDLHLMIEDVGFFVSLDVLWHSFIAFCFCFVGFCGFSPQHFLHLATLYFSSSIDLFWSPEDINNISFFLSL